MMGFWNIFKKKNLPMRDMVGRVEQDHFDSHWYLEGINNLYAKGKVSFNMQDVHDKMLALLCCTPLYSIVNKAGMMMSRGVPYVVDKDGNEQPRFAEIKRLLEKPNPFQTFSSFIKQVEISLKVFGYCPIVLVRSTRIAVPKSMWIVPSELFHMRGTGNVFRQWEAQEVVKRMFVSWGGKELDFEDYELMLVTDCQFVFPDSSDRDVSFESVTDSLSSVVSNWVCSIKASHTLMMHGGPKGIVYNDHVDEMGNVALTATDEEEIKKRFKDTYGLVGKEYPILVSRKKLGWIPLDYNADQLKLHEEDARCTEKICNAIGINPNIFTDAKYDNQESAKRAAYQDVIIPDSIKIAEALTKSICQDGVKITIDFSDVECLQPDKHRGAETLSRLTTSLSGLLSSGVITAYEARKELSKYIDINPDVPEVMNGGGNDEA